MLVARFGNFASLSFQIELLKEIRFVFVHRFKIFFRVDRNFFFKSDVLQSA